MSKSLQLAALAAYGSVALFALTYVMTIVAYKHPLVGSIALILSVSFQLLRFPIVALVPSEPWARASGYGSSVIHTVANVMLLNGVSASTVFALQLGANVLEAVWIASASWKAGGLVRVFGIPLVFLLCIYSLVAPWASRLVLLPEQLLLPVWLILIGRRLMKNAKLARLLVATDER